MNTNHRPESVMKALRTLEKIFLGPGNLLQRKLGIESTPDTFLFRSLINQLFWTTAIIAIGVWYYWI